VKKSFTLISGCFCCALLLAVYAFTVLERSQNFHMFKVDEMMWMWVQKLDDINTFVVRFSCVVRPFHAVSPTPPTKTWLNIFAILPFRLNRIVLPPVSFVYMTEEESRGNFKFLRFVQYKTSFMNIWVYFASNLNSAILCNLLSSLKVPVYSAKE